jgi:hypothetical protein
MSMGTHANGKNGSKPSHVVVTHWTAPGGRVVVHAYGPWSLAACTAERQRLLSRPEAEGRLTVHVCKMLDVRG